MPGQFQSIANSTEDWESLDIQQIKAACDGTAVARYLPIILQGYSDLEIDQNSKLGKLFVMAQICVKYLHDCLQQVCQNEEAFELKKANEKRAPSKCLVYQCLFCSKTFVSSHFLQNHLHRRHSNLTQLQSKTITLGSSLDGYRIPLSDQKIGPVESPKGYEFIPSDHLSSPKITDKPESLEQSKFLTRIEELEGRLKVTQTQISQETKHRLIVEQLQKSLNIQGEASLCSLLSELSQGSHAPTPDDSKKELQQDDAELVKQQESENGNDQQETIARGTVNPERTEVGKKQSKPVLAQSNKQFEAGFQDDQLHSLIRPGDKRYPMERKLSTGVRCVSLNKEGDEAARPRIKKRSILFTSATASTAGKIHMMKTLRPAWNEELEKRLQIMNIATSSKRIALLEVPDVLSNLKSARIKAWKKRLHLWRIRDDIQEKVRAKALAVMAQSSTIIRKPERDILDTMSSSEFPSDERKRIKSSPGFPSRGTSELGDRKLFKRSGTVMNCVSKDNWGTEAEYEVLRKSPMARDGES